MFNETTHYTAKQLADDPSWQADFIACAAYGPGRFTAITRTSRGAYAARREDTKRVYITSDKMFTLSPREVQQ